MFLNIAFLASHNGSAAKAVTDACADGRLPAEALLLISNNPDAKALDWAKDKGLKTAVINAGNAADPDAAIASLFEDNKIDLVVCSGYMKLIGPRTMASVPHILNVHPALLPKYGGKGMYGRFVHQAVFDNKDTETGITIHLVDDQYDSGRIVARKKVTVSETDTVDDIERKVKEAEPDFYVETLHKILSGLITL